MTETRILIYEPVAQGHQMHYVRHFLNSIEQRVRSPRVILLTTEGAAEHPNCRKLVGDFAGLVRLHVAPPVREGNAFFRTISTFQEYLWKNAETFEQGFAEIGPDNVGFVLLPHLEAIGLLHLCLRRDLFRGKPWATIIHNVRFHHRACGVEGPSGMAELAQRCLFRWLLRDPTLVRIGTNDIYLPEAVRHEKVALCPHPATAPKLTNPAEARKVYGIRQETCVVLVYGVIDRRKCVDLLMESVARLVPQLDVTVMIAGVQKPGEIEAVMDGAAARKLREHERLVEINRFIEEDRDIDPMSVADIVWVYYRREFRTISDVLTRAALSRLPVVARRLGVIGRVVDENQLGLTVPAEDPDAIAEAVSRLASDPVLRRSMGGNGPAIFSHNTPEDLTRPIVDAINRAMSAGSPQTIEAIELLPHPAQ
jgi:glycosyltransferase involved in cell wall biosynthesis